MPYIQLLSHKTEWNNAICGHTDGFRDYLTKWNKSEKDRYHVISLICERKWKWSPTLCDLMDCSLEIKRHLLLGRKAMTYLDSILKSRDVTLPTKIHLVKAMVFPVVMYGCESWTKESWAPRTWCWRRLLRVPWTARRPKQSIVKEISPEYSLEGLMLKLKLQYFDTWYEELTHLKRPWCWGRLKAGGEGHDRGWEGWMASLTQWTQIWVNSGSWWWTRQPGVLQAMGSQRGRHDWETELNWTHQFAISSF